MKVRDSGGAAEIRALQLDVAPKKVGELQLLMRPNRLRAIIDLPALGGVTPGNAGVTDLLECVIPHRQLNNESDLRRLIEGLGQLEDLNIHGTTNNSHKTFPINLNKKHYKK